MEEVTQPEQNVVKQSEEKEVKKPELKEVKQPEQKEVKNPEQKEVKEPEQKDVKESEQKEVPKVDVATENDKSNNVEKQNGCVDAVSENTEPVTKSVVKPLSPELSKKIINQIEYYFGNYNLPRDKFLSEEIKKDDGWITVATLCKFNRLAALTTDEDTIIQALQSAKIVEVNATEKKVRRSPSQPLPDMGDNLNEETVKRTIYLKGLKKDGSVTLDILLEYFKQYGEYEAIKMRKYNNIQLKQAGFKGSILVIYPEISGAKSLMEEDEIIFQNAPLLRKWYGDYLEEKKKEIEEWQAEKAERLAKRLIKEKAAASTPQEEEEPKPTGTYLHISGVPNTTSREDIKEQLSKHIDVDIAFVGLKRGDEECYVRLAVPFTNMDAVAQLKGKLDIKETEATVRAVIGTEEIDQVKQAKTARSNLVAKTRSNKRRGGGHHHGGPRFKKRRN